MLPILEKNLQKEYTLLCLLDSEDRYFSCQELAAQLGLSERTVYKHLQNLINRLEKIPAAELTITRSAALGIHLQRASWLSIHSIYAEFAQKSLIYDFFHSIFLETTDTTTAFCLNHFVSTASLYRSLSPMRQTLTDFSLHLSASDMRLTGEEMQIRYFYNNFYLQIFRGYGWPFPGISRQLIMNTIDDILSSLDAHMNVNDKKHFSYWLAVIAQRISLHHSLPSPLPVNLGLNNEAYHACKSSIRRFFQRLHLTASDAECQFIFYLLHAFPFGMNIQQRLFAAARDVRGFDCLPLTATDHFLAVFARNMHTLFAALSPHTCGQCFADERYLLPHYILLCSQSFDLTACEPAIKLALLTDYGPIYEEKIKKEIISRFRDDFHLQFVTTCQKYDILITNLPARIHTANTLTLAIHTAFNPREWHLLRQLLRQAQTAQLS